MLEAKLDFVLSSQNVENLTGNLILSLGENAAYDTVDIKINKIVYSFTSYFILYIIRKPWATNTIKDGRRKYIRISLFFVFIYCQNPKALWIHLVGTMIYERVNGKEDEWSEIRIDKLSL